jgi:hypothetical protein
MGFNLIMSFLCGSSERSERVVEKILGLPLSIPATGTSGIARFCKSISTGFLRGNKLFMDGASLRPDC